MRQILGNDSVQVNKIILVGKLSEHNMQPSQHLQPRYEATKSLLPSLKICKDGVKARVKAQEEKKMQTLFHTFNFNICHVHHTI